MKVWVRVEVKVRVEMKVKVRARGEVRVRMLVRRERGLRPHKAGLRCCSLCVSLPNCVSV